VHIRRALLLFAIVLGMAALVASLSRPASERTRTQQTQPGPGPTTTPEPAPETATPAPADTTQGTISFDAASRDRRRLAEGRAATLEVAVDEPGSVEIPDLGLTASADEHTPARFEVFPARAGRYAILFRPANGDEQRPAGTLLVTRQ
jgi:hypothetical protein